MSPTVDAADGLPRRIPSSLSSHASRRPPEPFHAPLQGGTAGLADRLAEGFAFAATVVRYLALVVPEARRERALWRDRARAIPSETLRQAAHIAVAQRGNIEGAALFAVLAARPHCRDTVRSLVALQVAYNYLDALSELPSADPRLNAGQLHRALLSAVRQDRRQGPVSGGEGPPGDPPHDAEEIDYYAHNPEREDGGYLAALVEACREGLSRLPSYEAFAPVLSAAAIRVAEFQQRNLPEAHGGQTDLERWASAPPRARYSLAWWETAAGAGSSLALHALIAMAGRAELGRPVAERIDRAYFPAIGALHSLLDSLVDRDEDRDKGQRSLLEHYRSSVHAANRMTILAFEARAGCEPLPARRTHRVIVTAMCSYYLSAPQARSEEGRTARAYLLDALGMPLHLAILMFRAKRVLAWLTGVGYV